MTIEARITPINRGHSSALRANAQPTPSPHTGKLILALALGASAAKYDRSFEMNVKDTAVSSIEAANLCGEVETAVRGPRCI